MRCRYLGGIGKKSLELGPDPERLGTAGQECGEKEKGEKKIKQNAYGSLLGFKFRPSACEHQILPEMITPPIIIHSGTVLIALYVFLYF